MKEQGIDVVVTLSGRSFLPHFRSTLDGPTILHILQQFATFCNNSLHFATILCILQQFNTFCNNSIHVATMHYILQEFSDLLYFATIHHIFKFSLNHRFCTFCNNSQNCPFFSFFILQQSEKSTDHPKHATIRELILLGKFNNVTYFETIS